MEATYQAADSMTYLATLSSDVLMDNSTEQEFPNIISSINESIFTQSTQSSLMTPLFPFSNSP